MLHWLGSGYAPRFRGVDGDAEGVALKRRCAVRLRCGAGPLPLEKVAAARLCSEYARACRCRARDLVCGVAQRRGDFSLVVVGFLMRLSIRSAFETSPSFSNHDDAGLQS